MIVRLSIVVILLVAASMVPMTPTTAWARQDVLSSQDLIVARQAMAAVNEKKWALARSRANRLRDPAARKLFQWLEASEPGADTTFEAIAAFIEANPDWPDQTLLRRRAEEAMTAGISPAKVLAWLKDHEPVSADGHIRLTEALLDTGDQVAGRAAARRTWIESNFGAVQEASFYRRHQELLTGDDHWWRLDRLLWQGSEGPARRMLSKVDIDHRALAEARLVLRKGKGNPNGALARVAKKYRNDAGLIYERVRWRRRNGLEDEARDLLLRAPAQPPYPERWWQERAVLARQALAHGFISEAYRLAKDHDLTDGAGFSEGEWLAGWIALRFLGDIVVAKEHFKRMFEVVEYPVSRARAAYWSGRTAEAMNDKATAESWYRLAAGYPTTYYGQLGASRLGNGHRAIPEPPQPTKKDRTDHAAHELTRAARILHALGESDRMRPFLVALLEAGEMPGWQALTAELAKRLGRPDLAIFVAKRASRAGHELVEMGYPTVKVPPLTHAKAPAPPETALVLALVRQESAYRKTAVSSAGARGLMQLMPATAKRTAEILRVPFVKGRLTSDPSYNLTLGQAYLGDMLKTYDGSYVLALAAYNAGPSRVKRWVQEYGHPRDAEVNTIDWVELIPFEETRNYVQRVLENLQVYRAQLGATELAMTLENDLSR